MSPTTTYQILLAVQALHLLHHRLAKRHISFAEVVSSLLLCVPTTAPIWPALLMGAHLAAATIQIIGSLAIRRLSPDWPAEEVAR